SGNRLADFRSEFTTAVSFDTNRPSVVSQRPGNGASGVPLSASVVLFVNKPLSPSTITGALHVSQNGSLVNGSIQVTGNGQVIQFLPAAPWQNNALIQVFLDNSARDLSSNALNNYQGSFRTVSDTSTTAPVVVRFVPSGSAVVLNPII